MSIHHPVIELYTVSQENRHVSEKSCSGTAFCPFYLKTGVFINFDQLPGQTGMGILISHKNLIKLIVNLTPSIQL